MGLLAQTTSIPSIPTDITALGALVLLVWWLVRRSDRSDEARATDVERIQSELDEVRAKYEAKSDEKHHAVARMAAYRGALIFARRAMADCSDCPGLDAATALIDDLLDETRREIP